MKQFRSAVKALAQLVPDEPKRARRRCGETKGDFARLARHLARRFDVRRHFRKTATRIARRQPGSDAYAAATVYLADTLAWLNLWQHNDAEYGADLGDNLEQNQNDLSPRL